jgi:hypothetical protein
MGPGEFRSLHMLYVLDGDSLLAFDGGVYRFSIFDSTGEFVRVFQPEQTAEGLVWPLANIGQGRILLGTGQPFGGQLTTGVHMDSADFMIADLSGAIEEMVGRFPFYERYVHLYPGGIRSTIGLPFGRGTQVAAGNGRIYLTTADGFQIYVHGVDGGLERIFRIAQELRPVTQTDIERYVDSRQRLTNPRRRGVEARLLHEIPFPETFPPFADLVRDTEGYLWATEYRRPGDRSARWIIFDPEGRWLGAVEGPDGFRAYQIGSDYILGVHVDELGVEQVQMYLLNRS